MRIFSTFKDFYDIYRDDKTSLVKYDRKMSEIYVKCSIKQLNGFDAYTISHNLRFLGFCGEIIPFAWYGATVCYINEDPQKTLDSNYSDGFQDVIAAFCAWKGEDYVRPKKYIKPESRLYFRGFKDDDFSWLKEHAEELKKDFTAIFGNSQVPVFIIDSIDFWNGENRQPELYYHVILNPNLRDIHFVKQRNPAIAYSQIETFIGNFLVSDKMKIDPIPDTLKAESHGFDKFSFRIGKGEKKNRKSKV